MIRAATEADVPAILNIYAPYILTTTITFAYDVPCKRSFLQRFYEITAQFPWLVWEENGTILGYAYASAPFARPAYAWCAEPSIYLAQDARGKGIGRKLYAALEAILKDQGYQVLYALITEENTASLHFHQRQNYSFLANFPNCGYKFNRWLGVIWMEKRISPVRAPNSYPIPFSKYCQDVQRLCDILDTLSLS